MSPLQHSLSPKQPPPQDRPDRFPAEAMRPLNRPSRKTLSLLIRQNICLTDLVTPRRPRKHWKSGCEVDRWTGRLPKARSATGWSNSIEDREVSAAKQAADNRAGDARVSCEWAIAHAEGDDLRARANQRSKQRMMWRGREGSGTRSLAGIPQKPPPPVFFHQVVHFTKPAVERDPFSRLFLGAV